MPRGRHRHSPPLHRLLPPSAIAGVSVVCALGPWVFSAPVVLRSLAAAAAVAAVAGAVVMRRWDTQAGRQVADLTRARASDEWRFEERVAELETDLEESRELRGRLEQKLRAKRAELAGLRNEHAALLRRYATAETERASALEGRRLLEIEAGSDDVRALPAAPDDRADRTPADADTGAEAGVGTDAGKDVPEEKADVAPAVFSPEGSRLFLRADAALLRLAAGPENGGTTPEDGAETARREAAGKTGASGQAEAAGDAGTTGDAGTAGQAGAAGNAEAAGDAEVAANADAAGDDEAAGQAEDAGNDGETAKAGAADQAEAAEDAEPTGKTERPARTSPAAEAEGAGRTASVPKQGRVSGREADPTAQQAGGTDGGPAAASPAREDEPQGQPEAADAHEPAAAASPTEQAARAAQPEAQAGPAGQTAEDAKPAATAKPVQQPSGHFTVPTAVAVVPAAPTRRPVVEGGFDFFGTQKGAPSTALDAVQNEDLADVVGQEALALHKAESESQYKPADAGAPVVGQVIDLTAHDETEQIDVQGLRTAAS
ncbi:hypothetical protein ACFW88_25370 [Streptomyces anandii]|uniref:Secreted protein n=1 Tax=Streptomyces anandii TaxID=285454 RepID=A0ABW6HB32_9ACTN